MPSTGSLQSGRWTAKGRQGAGDEIIFMTRGNLRLMGAACAPGQAWGRGKR